MMHHLKKCPGEPALAIIETAIFAKPVSPETFPVQVLNGQST
jgi:hypothetical protein